MSIEITTERIAGALAVSQFSRNELPALKYATILSAMPLNVPLTAKEIKEVCSNQQEKLKEKIAPFEDKSWFELTKTERELRNMYAFSGSYYCSHQQISWFGKFMQEVGYVKVERVPLDEPYEIKIPYDRYNYETRQYEEKEKVIKVDTITKYTRIV